MATQPVQPAETPANTSVRRNRRLVIANDNDAPTPPTASPVSNVIRFAQAKAMRELPTYLLGGRI